MKLIFCLLISISAFSQKDSTVKAKLDSLKIKAKPDSVFAYNDTVVLKIPAKYVHGIIGVLTGDDQSLTLGDFRFIAALINKQVMSQITKKPKK